MDKYSQNRTESMNPNPGTSSGGSNRESTIQGQEISEKEKDAAKKEERSREFRKCFSIIESELEQEAAQQEKKKANRASILTTSFASKGKKHRLKPSTLFRKQNSNISTNFYDAENELLDERNSDRKSLLSPDQEICTLRREVSSNFSRRTLWTRDSICDPSCRSSLPEAEKMFLGLTLDDDSVAVYDLLGKVGLYKNFIECTDAMGRTALHLAAACGNTKVARTLLEKGAQVEVWDTANTATPLMCAASAGREETLRVLLEWKADVNTGYENGKTALYWACTEGHFNCVKTLLEFGAKQSATAIFSETPLHIAATRGEPELLKLLLDNGADVTLLSGAERNTALHMAAQEADLESCRLLVNAGASPNSQNSRGLTPLHYAAFGNPELTDFLLVSGANPNIADSEGRSPLFYAVGKGEIYEECLELLLVHNANVNLQDQSGYSPLHIAAVKEASKSTSILLRYGADLTLKNMARQTGLSLFTKRVPDAMKVFKDYLDDSITITVRNFKANVKLDFTPLVPNHLSKPNRKKIESKHQQANRKKTSLVEVPRETELIRCFLETGMEEILLHPLVEAFLYLKWKRLRKFFILSFIMQMTLVLAYSSFILDLYKDKCPYSLAMTHIDPNSTMSTTTVTVMTMSTVESMTISPPSPELPDPETTEPESNVTAPASLTAQSNQDERDKCSIPSYFSWSVVIFLGVIIILKEIIQFIQNPRGYVTNVGNWILLLFLLSISLTIVPPDTLVDSGFAHLLRLQYPIAAVGVLLAWGLMFVQFGKFPWVGLYVQMLVKVGSNFLTFLLVYFFIMIAFAMAFSLLFPSIKTFGSFYEIFLKLLRIMTGDVNIEYIIYDADTSASVPIIPLIPSVPMANVVHTICVVLLSVILMNLLIGLAVNDIQGLYRSAKLKKLFRQAELIAYLESFILSKRFLFFLHPSLRSLLVKSAIVAPTYYKCFFYFHPNDKEDKRLPEVLKSAIINLKEKHPLENIHSGRGHHDMQDCFKRLEIHIAALEAKIEELIMKKDN